MKQRPHQNSERKRVVRASFQRANAPTERRRRAQVGGRERSPAADTHRGEAGPVRLQKFLSDAGVASRRRAEELILEGRVLLNDAIVESLPAFVDPAKDRVIVDGTLVHLQAPTYFLVHKPRGFVCTNHDPDGRPRAVDLLPPIPERLFPVGRLDTESSGLLLMTNDGELAMRITHPRYGIPKKYRVEVSGQTAGDLVERMRNGVYLAEGKASASEVEVIHRSRDRSVMIVTLRERRQRQVRRMLARLGYPVRELKRVQIGPLTLKGLPVGAARKLAPPEVSSLLAAIENAPTDATFELRRRHRRRSRRAPAEESREGASSRSAAAPDRAPPAKPAATRRPPRRDTPRRPAPGSVPGPAAPAGSPKRRIIR